MRRIPFLSCLALLRRSLATQAPPPKPASYPQLPSETPETLVPSTGTFDFEKREVMIPMRAGTERPW